MNSTYTAKWQYLLWVGTHKDPPEKNKGKDPKDDLSTKEMTKKSSPYFQNEFNVGIKAFNFQELVEALRDGHCIKRIGSIVSHYGSRFLIIDIDNDNDERVTPEELDSFCKSRDNIEWTIGGSGRQFRYHILKLLSHPISTSTEAENETKAVLAELTEHIARDIEIIPDPCQFRLLQWCFGVPQERMERRELPNTEVVCRQITKSNGYKIIKEGSAEYHSTLTKKPSKSRKHATIMPYNTAQLANLLNDNHLRASKRSDGAYALPMVRLEGRRFDCYEPRIINRFVRVGHRYDTALAWIYRLAPQFYRCKELGLHYTEEDLKYTFHTLCNRNFEKADDWWDETGESMLDLLESELKSNEGLAYKDIEAKYQSSHKRELYKRKGYNGAVTMDILDSHRVDSANNPTAVFHSRKELVALLDDVRVSYSSFMAYAAMIGDTVVYEDDKRDSHKYDYIDENIGYTDNIWFYAFQNESVKSHCKRKKYRYMSLYKLYSGSKAKYNRVLEVTQEAIKAMHKFFDNPNRILPVKKVEDEDYELPELPFYPEDDPLESTETSLGSRDS